MRTSWIRRRDSLSKYSRYRYTATRTAFCTYKPLVTYGCGPALPTQSPVDHQSILPWLLEAVVTICRMGVEYSIWYIIIIYNNIYIYVYKPPWEISPVPTIYCMMSRSSIQLRHSCSPSWTSLSCVFLCVSSHDGLCYFWQIKSRNYACFFPRFLEWFYKSHRL